MSFELLFLISESFVVRLEMAHSVWWICKFCRLFHVIQLEFMSWFCPYEGTDFGLWHVIFWYDAWILVKWVSVTLRSYGVWFRLYAARWAQIHAAKQVIGIDSVLERLALARNVFKIEVLVRLALSSFSDVTVTGCSTSFLTLSSSQTWFLRWWTS